MALALVLVLTFWTIRRSVWAEVELLSLQAAQDGQITAQFAVRYPNGGGVEFTSYVDGQPQGGGGVGGRSILPLPMDDSKDVEFNLNPERSRIEGGFTNSVLFRRLLVQVGERHRIRTGKPLYLYDFVAGKHRHQMIVACKGDPSPAPPEQTATYTPEQAAQFFKMIMQESGKGNDPYVALAADRSSAPYLSELVRLFPQAEVNYRNFSGAFGFDVAVDLFERYEFQMQLPARFDSSHQSVTGYGEPRFHLREVDRVETRKNRTGVTWYKPAGERTFGSPEWRRIVEGGGDFGVIGYSMITNRPVAGFKDRKIEK